GNYARRRYDIGQLAKSEINAGYQPRQNEIVYINLDENTEGIHEFAGASLIKPAQGLFIKGRIQRHGGNDYRVKYGIEAYFAPLDKAYELERELQDGGIATVMIAQNGKAALQSIDAS
ncbi:MAG: hypothetical protein GTN53_46960, partial [Candidatus Aminicenantes bacterium]|nr:hypothetical protein [Gammaproteobacteria bacterium]NIO61867.1 hypothetical protein [Gammaproteobacteria bacterium]NIO88209.1 hypothetical protein [Candidatus Aminicenantes bacterium]NIT30053.1 hypothetical protein [Candidatus Aminicenantes bacterium]